MAKELNSLLELVSEKMFEISECFKSDSGIKVGCVIWTEKDLKSTIVVTESTVKDLKKAVDTIYLNAAPLSDHPEGTIH